MKKIFFVISCLFFFNSCEEALYNDLALQGEWEKDCEIEYEKMRMRIKIDSDTLYYKKADAADWQNSVGTSASGGFIYLKSDDSKIEGSYNIVWSKCLFSRFEYADGFMWLNGVWDKQ